MLAYSPLIVLLGKFVPDLSYSASRALLSRIKTVWARFSLGHTQCQLEPCVCMCKPLVSVCYRSLSALTHREYGLLQSHATEMSLFSLSNSRSCFLEVPGIVHGVGRHTCQGRVYTLPGISLHQYFAPVAS